MYNNISLPTFDSLPYQSALLDSNGIIVAVNDAWRSFAESNGGSAQLREGVGLDYLAICRAARGKFSDDAPIAVASIERNLNGDHARSTFRYPCHSPSVNRWFLCASASTDITQTNRGALVSHVELADLNQSRRTVQAPGNGRLAYEHLQNETSTGCWELDPSFTSLWWTPETYRIHGTSPETFVATFDSMLKFYSPKNQSLLETLFLQLVHHGAPFEVELPSLIPGRGHVWIRMSGRAKIQGVKILGLYGAIQDITARRDLQRRLSRAERNRQR